MAWERVSPNEGRAHSEQRRRSQEKTELAEFAKQRGIIKKHIEEAANSLRWPRRPFDAETDSPSLPPALARPATGELKESVSVGREGAENGGRLQKEFIQKQRAFTV